MLLVFLVNIINTCFTVSVCIFIIIQAWTAFSVFFLSCFCFLILFTCFLILFTCCIFVIEPVNIVHILSLFAKSAYFMLKNIIIYINMYTCIGFNTRLVMYGWIMIDSTFCTNACIYAACMHESVNEHRNCVHEIFMYSCFLFLLSCMNHWCRNVWRHHSGNGSQCPNQCCIPIQSTTESSQWLLLPVCQDWSKHL